MSRTEQAAAPEPGARPAAATPAAVTTGSVRVRHQAREALSVMAFSATASVLLALALLLLASLGR